MSLIKIGNTIRELRIAEGISQKEMAEKLNIPRSTYSNYENDNRVPDKETLDRIAEALGVTSNGILGIPEKGIDKFSSFKELLNPADQEYADALKTFFELQEQISSGGRAFHADPIKDRIINVGLDNFKNILSLKSLEILNASLIAMLSLKDVIKLTDKGQDAKIYFDVVEDMTRNVFHL